MSGLKRTVLALCTALPLLAGTCALGTRDALVAGAFDFVSGTTTQLMSLVFAQAMGLEET